MIADALAPQAEAQAINAVRDDWQRLSGVAAAKAAPALIENGQLVMEIMSMSRKKGGKEQIAATLNAVEINGVKEGERSAREAFTRQSALERRTIDEAIVCAFIVEVRASEKLTDGMQPGGSFSVASFTMTKVIEALGRAGYSESGVTNGVRNLENRRALGI